MYNRFLITGATGFLGRTVVEMLVRRGADVRALVLPNDPYENMLPDGVQRSVGNICDEDSLNDFFENVEPNTCLIHCAGIVSIASDVNRILFDVNIQGTENIVRQCLKHKVARMIYVSSVHAFPDKPMGKVIDERDDIVPARVSGDYAKSKAAATNIAENAIRNGLNVGIVFPSGIIGPGDVAVSGIALMLKQYLKGRLPLAVAGGYDFVDVRDVAQGIIHCAEYGEMGERYILSGHYSTIRNMLGISGKIVNSKRRAVYLPVKAARLFARIYESYCIRRKKPLFFTPYAVDVLASNGLFSHFAATNRFGYQPRPLEETLRDMIPRLEG